jgi:hypothetical protein
MSIGVWLVILNWGCFYVGFIKKIRSPSWIPIFPGLLIFLGFRYFPENVYSNFSWIAFIIDWGCLPGISYTIFFHFDRLRKDREK